MTQPKPPSLSTDSFLVAFAAIFVVMTLVLIGAFLTGAYAAIGVALAGLFVVAIWIVLTVARIAGDG
jgi:hypothetical protein